MKPYTWISVVLTLAASASCPADILELKSGQVINGKYTGGTAGTVRFETSAGVQVFETSQVVALTFTAPAAAATAAAPAPAPASPSSPAPTAAPAAAQAAPVPPKSVTLPAGTLLLVRMMDGASSRNPPGSSFTTKLEYNLAADGVVAIPAGTVIYGKVQSSTQARRAVGRSTLDLRLVRVVLGGNPVPIVTSGHQQAGKASIAKAAKGAAAGAAIGAIVDGGDGAGTGAAIGATAGALMRGETITVTPGTLLEFTLSQPVTITTAP